MNVRRPLIPAISFFFILLLIPTATFAFPLPSPVTDSIGVAENLRIIWDRTANNSDYDFWGVVNRATVNVTKGPVSLGLRYDVDLAFTDEEDNAFYRPRKYYFQVRQRGLDVQLGDFYASFGRGIVLNVLKNDEFGEDTSIQGQRLAIETDYVSFKGLAGLVNPGDEIRFTPEQAVGPDLAYEDRDVLWGAETVFSWPGIVSVGGRFVGATIRVDPDDVTTPAEYEWSDSHERTGLSVEFPDIFGVASFYAEYAWLYVLDRKKDDLLEDEEWEGRAAYFNFVAYFHGVDLLIEGKDYFLAGLDYAEGPSLEYQKVVFDLPHYDDEIGLRGRIGYKIPRIDFYAWLNYLHTKTHQLEPDDLSGHYDQSDEYKYQDGVRHLYGGIEKDFANGAFADVVAGYREVELGRWVHAELEGGIPFLPTHSIDGTIQWRQFQGLGYDEDTTYGSEFFQLAYNWAPYLNVTAQYEHSDEPLAGATGGGTVGSTSDPKENFHAVEVKIKPVESVVVTLFYGAVRGGLRCSGGVCRQVPAFEGMKAELALQF